MQHGRGQKIELKDLKFKAFLTKSIQNIKGLLYNKQDTSFRKKSLVREKKKLLVWQNKCLANRVGFFFWFFFKCVYCIYCSKCLCSCTIELNKTKKQQHNFIPPSCAPFQCFIALIIKMKSKSGIFLVKLRTEFPCCSKKTHQNPSLTIKKTKKQIKQNSGSDQILVSGGLRQTNFIFF